LVFSWLKSKINEKTKKESIKTSKGVGNLLKPPNMATATATRRSTEPRGIRTYLHRILNEASPGTSISRGAMDCTNTLMTLAVERIVRGSLIIAQRVGNVTLSADDIRAATEIVLPPELAEAAVRAGDQAVQNYWRESNQTTSQSSGVTSPKGGRRSQTVSTASTRSQPAANSRSQLTASAIRRQPVRRASRAELIMAPPRIESMIRTVMQQQSRSISRSGGQSATIDRLSEDAGVFLAAVIQYLSEELFRVGGAATSEASRRLMRDTELMTGLRRHPLLCEFAGLRFLSHYSQTEGAADEEPLESSQVV
jgi:histone H3/H4